MRWLTLLFSTDAPLGACATPSDLTAPLFTCIGGPLTTLLVNSLVVMGYFRFLWTQTGNK